MSELKNPTFTFGSAEDSLDDLDMSILELSEGTPDFDTIVVSGLNLVTDGTKFRDALPESLRYEVDLVNDVTTIYRTDSARAAEGGAQDPSTPSTETTSPSAPSDSETSPTSSDTGGTPVKARGETSAIVQIDEAPFMPPAPTPPAKEPVKASAPKAAPKEAAPKKVTAPIEVNNETAEQYLKRRFPTLQVLPALTGGLIKNLDGYVKTMARTAPVTKEVGATNQRNLYTWFQQAIGAPPGEYKIAIEAVLFYFNKYKDGAFSTAMVYRFIQDIRMSKADIANFQNLINLFMAVADPATRRQNLVSKVNIRTIVNGYGHVQHASQLMDFFRT